MISDPKHNLSFLREHRRTIVFTLMFLIVAVFYLLTLTRGHDWGDDFAMYITHAVNIVSGKPYTASGYIYNPNFPDLGPKAYPPLFPLLLAPIVVAAGVNLYYLKMTGVLAFALFQPLFFSRVVPRRHSLVFAGTLFLLIGLLPLFWQTSDQILSDLPFLSICFLALIQIEHSASSEPIAKENYLHHLTTGLLIYLAYATRSIGLILVPVYLVYSVFRARKLTAAIAVGVSTAIGLIIIQGIFLPQTGSYLDQIPKDISALAAEFRRLIQYYANVFPNLLPIKDHLLKLLLTFLMSGLGIVGLIGYIRKGVRVFEVFFVMYFVSLFFWPSTQGLRLLIPIIPLFFLYVLEGIAIVMERLIRSARIYHLSLFCISGFILLSFGAYYAKAIPRPKDEEITGSSTRKMFSFVRNEIPAEEIIGFYKPRALALYTGHPSIAVVGISDCDMINDLQKNEVDYFIVDVENNPRAWWDYDQSDPQNYRLVYKNSGYKVFKMQYQGKCIQY